jgi:hypothetical protein
MTKSFKQDANTLFLQWNSQSQGRPEIDSQLTHTWERKTQKYKHESHDPWAKLESAMQMWHGFIAVTMPNDESPQAPEATELTKRLFAHGSPFCLRHATFSTKSTRLTPTHPLFFFFFLVELGFELMALCLQSKHSTTLATLPIHFVLVILEMGFWRTICPGWPWTTILPISASQVARILGVGHQQLKSTF